MRTHLGQYRIDETLGRGGMGVVFRGAHENLGRTVAIKALAPELTQQPEFKERFFAEAKTQARLLHPNIVGVYDLVEDDGEFFIVMEHVDGVGLDDRFDVATDGAVDPATATNVMGQVLSALDYAHSEGVIHRDIKPSNIMITGEGRVKLTDFGIALLVGDKRLTSSQSTIGTPTYMSPEQILTPRSVDHRADIYSAAVVFYEMLAGRPPFDDETEYGIKKQHVENPPPDLLELQPSLPPALVLAIATALAKDPEARFPSAGAFWREIEAAVPGSEGASLVPSPAPPLRSRPTVLESPGGVGSVGGPVPPPTAPPSSTHRMASLLPPGKARWLVAGGAVLALVFGALLWIALLGPDEESDAPEQVPPISAMHDLATDVELRDQEREDGEAGNHEARRLAVEPGGEIPPADEKHRPAAATAEAGMARPASTPAPAKRPAPVPDPQPAPPPVPEPATPTVEPEPQAQDPVESTGTFDFTAMRDVMDDLVRLSEQAADAADDEGLDSLDDRLDDFHEAASDSRKTFRRATRSGALGRFRPKQGTEEAAFDELEIEIANLEQTSQSITEFVTSYAAGTKTADLWSEVRERVRRLGSMSARP